MIMPPGPSNMFKINSTMIMLSDKHKQDYNFNQRWPSTNLVQEKVPEIYKDNPS